MRVKKLYLITQNVNFKYDTYDSAVVVAYSKALARKIEPSEYAIEWHQWAEPKDVNVQYLGKASSRLKINEVITASFYYKKII